MKSKKRKSDYTGLKRKLYSYVFLAMIAAIAVVVLLRQLVRGIVGERIVGFLTDNYHLEQQAAMRIYQ